MWRCIDLAQQAAGRVAPNPMVGAVLVYENEIIGEGYHQEYGGPHAEVNCIHSVSPSESDLIPKSTLYVSLEPCVHFGKTPPCADLIISKKITHVVLGCRDPFVEVNGKGIEKLLATGVNVVQGVLERECKEINKRFFTFHTQHRPYIILKWAQTVDKKIGNYGNNRLQITNEITNRLVHKWRNEEMGIMVGTNTAMLDDPKLTNRFWQGANPLRIVIDNDLCLPSTLNIFDGSVKTIVFNTIKHEEAPKNMLYYQITHDVNLVHQVLNGLYQLKVLSVIIEGGARLLQSFIDEGAWDEARVITNTALHLNDGVPSPELTDAQLTGTEKILDDVVEYYGKRLPFAVSAAE